MSHASTVSIPADLRIVVVAGIFTPALIFKVRKTRTYHAARVLQLPKVRDTTFFGSRKAYAIDLRGVGTSESKLAGEIACFCREVVNGPEGIIHQSPTCFAVTP